ncbi:MAG: hypothetical protein R6V49_02895 [Bacteroidales bacterium]
MAAVFLPCRFDNPISGETTQKTSIHLLTKTNMKKSIVLVIASLFLMAGVVYATGSIKSEVIDSKSSIEMPDKDPKAKTAGESKDKACCTSDKSCKTEGKSCDSSKKAEGKSACCTKSKAEGSAEKSEKPAGTTTTAAAEKSNCAKTKCQ